MKYTLHPYRGVVNSPIGDDTVIWDPCNIYNSTIGKNCRIGKFVEIGGSKVGDDCKIEAYVFIPPGVTIGNHVFIGPHVCFTNDKWPRANSGEWKVCRTVVEDDVSIGANCTILSGITLRKGAMVGAGSVVCKNVMEKSLVYGDGAKRRRTIH